MITPADHRRSSADDAERIHAQTRDDERASQADRAYQRERLNAGTPSDPPCMCTFSGDTADTRDCPAHGTTRSYMPAAITLTPPRRIACPRCHAEPGARCVDKSGAYMSRYHRERTAAARPAAAPQAEPPTPAAAPELPSLDAQVEALVARYTCGSVIDAAWAASARLFRPGQRKGAA